jgi:predicted MFS family arabinose efflux permease
MSINLLSINRLYVKNYDGLSRACWIGIIINLIESVLIGVYYFLSLYFVNELHLDISTSGLILSCYGIGAVIGGILGGKMSDKISSGFVMIVCLLIQAGAYFSLLGLTSIHILMLVVGMLGLATYAFLTANHMWVLSQCGHDEGEKLRVINILSISSNFGFGISAMIISQAVFLGYHSIFAVTALIFFMVSAFLFIWEVKCKKLNNMAIDVADQSQEKCEGISLKGEKYNRSILIILLSVFLIGSVVAQFGSTYAIYIRDTFPQLNVNGVGMLYATNAFIVVIFSAPLGNAIKRFNKIKMVGIGGLLIGAGMVMLAESWSFIFVMLACIIYTIGEIIFFSMAQLICYQNGHGNKKGRSLGIYRSIYAMSRIAGPASGSYAYMHLGGNVVWYFCGAIGLFCFVACNFLKTVNS